MGFSHQHESTFPCVSQLNVSMKIGRCVAQFCFALFCDMADHHIRRPQISSLNVYVSDQVIGCFCQELNASQHFPLHETETRMNMVINICMVWFFYFYSKP